jgi:hypothetical protein
MKSSADQKGFSFVILLVILVAFIGLFAAGWYVWNKNKQNKNTNHVKTTTQTNSNDQKQKLPSDDAEHKYLVIREWGVKLPLSSEISEAYYKIESDGSIDYVALYDAAFDKLKNANNVPCGGDNVFQFYSISRIKSADLAALNESSGPNYQQFPFSKEYLFGGLGAHQAPPACSNLNTDPYGEGQDDKNILDIANNKEQSFDKAFKQLQTTE